MQSAFATMSRLRSQIVAVMAAAAVATVALSALIQADPLST
jgi:hypothetical protein